MRWIIVFALGMLLLTGCDTLSSTAPTPLPSAAAAPRSTSTTGTANTTPVSTTPDAYPAPNAAYPAPAAAGAYPAPVQKQGPKFTINEPIKVADSQVSGTGPSGVTIKLMDITSGGQNLGETTISSDGTYKFDVAGKLKAGSWLAVQLGSSQSNGVNPEDFISGPGYQDTPFVGVIFTSTHVQ